MELEPGTGEASAPGVLESAYVLEGSATLSADGEAIAAPAGTWVQVPAGVERAWSADAPARLLVVRTPGR